MIGMMTQLKSETLSWRCRSTMIKKIMPLLLSLILILSSCSSNASTDRPKEDNSSVNVTEPLGYDFVIFDSDDNAVKDDIAELTCLGMSGGYGSFRLEVFVSGEKSYYKVFDSEQYTLDDAIYKKLSENIDGELMIDTFYSVEAEDTDNDGGEELICKQYVWEGCHTNHIGDIITIFKIADNDIEIIEVRFESLK